MCGKCHKQFPHSQMVKDHYISAHGEGFKCDQSNCGKKFLNRCTLQRHIREKHTGNNCVYSTHINELKCQMLSIKEKKKIGFNRTSIQDRYFAFHSFAPPTFYGQNISHIYCPKGTMSTVMG